jgi:hypothetical protein
MYSWTPEQEATFQVSNQLISLTSREVFNATAGTIGILIPVSNQLISLTSRESSLRDIGWLRDKPSTSSFQSINFPNE